MCLQGTVYENEIAIKKINEDIAASEEASDALFGPMRVVNNISSGTEDLKKSIFALEKEMPLTPAGKPYLLSITFNGNDNNKAG